MGHFVQPFWKCLLFRNSLSCILPQLPSETLSSRCFLAWNACKLVSEASFITQIVELYNLSFQERQTFSETPQIFKRCHIYLLYFRLTNRGFTWGFNEVTCIYLIKSELCVFNVFEQTFCFFFEMKLHDLIICQLKSQLLFWGKIHWKQPHCRVKNLFLLFADKS
mgnify:CR=1 FL=1